MAEDTQVVSFRLTTSQVNELRELAEQRRCGLGECARSMVLEAMLAADGDMASAAAYGQIALRLTVIEEDLRDIAERLGSVERDSSDTFQHLFELRKHFRKATLATLYGAGQVSLEDARKWCDDNLKSELE